MPKQKLILVLLLIALVSAETLFSQQDPNIKEVKLKIIFTDTLLTTGEKFVMPNSDEIKIRILAVRYGIIIVMTYNPHPYPINGSASVQRFRGGSEYWNGTWFLEPETWSGYAVYGLKNELTGVTFIKVKVTVEDKEVIRNGVALGSIILFGRYQYS